MTLIATLAIILGLTTAMLAKTTYERLVQQPHCLAHAASHLPDTSQLVFEGVVIATNQFHGHTCIFRTASSNSLITLKFDDADIPVILDTVQVLVMVLGFLTGGLPALKWWPRYPSSRNSHLEHDSK